MASMSFTGTIGGYSTLRMLMCPIVCCAMQSNTEAAGLKEDADVLIHFVIDRSPIGSMKGMSVHHVQLYAFPSSWQNR